LFPLHLSFKAKRRRKIHLNLILQFLCYAHEGQVGGGMTRVETLTRKPDDPAPRHGALDGTRRTTCRTVRRRARVSRLSQYSSTARITTTCAHTGIRRRRERHAARAHAPRDRPDELTRPGTRTGRGQWQFGATEPSKQRERETKSIIRNDMNGINKINKPIDIYTLHPNHISMFCLNGRPSHYE
jgi:hypothetical protein